MLQFCNWCSYRSKFESLLTLQVLWLSWWIVTETLTMWHNLKHRECFCCFHYIFIFTCLVLVSIITWVLCSVVLWLGVWNFKHITWKFVIVQSRCPAHWSVGHLSPSPWILILLAALIDIVTSTNLMSSFMWLVFCHAWCLFGMCTGKKIMSSD